MVYSLLSRELESSYTKLGTIDNLNGLLTLSALVSALVSTETVRNDRQPKWFTHTLASAIASELKVVRNNRQPQWFTHNRF